MLRPGYRSLLFDLCAVALAAAWSVSAPAQSRRLITKPVDSTVRAQVPRSVHPLATAEFDRGPVNPAQQLDRLILVLGASPEQDLQLRTLLDSQQTAGARDYHHWLTPEDFGRRFGPSLDDLQQVKEWLEQQGFAVGAAARSGRWIEFTGTAQQVNDVFQTSLHHYQVAGAMHVANATAISVPAALAPVVRGVFSLHDFFSAPQLTHHYQIARNQDGLLVPTDPNFTYNPGDFHYLVPADYANIYNLGPLHARGADGAGRTIAIVARSKIELTDLAIFRSIFGLPDNPPQMIVNGRDPGFTGSDDSVEASLDAEWAGAVAPAATIKLVVGGSSYTTDGVALSAAYAVDNNVADVLSVSFGQCEKTLGSAQNAFWAALWEQAAAQGISVFVSSGDSGAAGCDWVSQSGPATQGLQVNGLASTAFNSAVGGTQFQESGNDSTFWHDSNDAAFGSSAGYIPEAVWNESCDPSVNSQCALGVFSWYSLAAGGGGVSTIYTKPAWQAGSGVPNDGHRDLPDISLAAAADHDGYLLCFMGSCQTTTDSQGAPLLLQAAVVGGTSASAPAFAGMMALIDQQAGGRQGLANYVLYKLAATETFSQCDSSAQTDPAVRAPGCIFNDITAGNNNVPGQTGYSAGLGFDLASGLGSVNAVNLLEAWSSAAVNFQGSITTLSASVNGAPASSISVPHGSAVSLTAQVQAIAGTAVPTGDVAFVTDHYGAVGSGALADGAFTGAISSLPGGTYNLSAHYAGDGTFAASDSNAIAVNVTPENSVVTLSTSAGNGSLIAVQYGAWLSLLANVVSVSGNGSASGTVTFFDGGTALGTVPLNSAGNAELFVCGTDACLAIGSHTITASYSGDNSLNASTTAQALNVSITKSDYLGAFLEIIGPDNKGMCTFLAVLYPPSSWAVMPTGTIQFLDGSTPLGPVLTLAMSPATGAPTVTTTVRLSPGTYHLGFSYSGDSTYEPYTFPSTPFTVQAPFELSTRNDLVSIKPGQTATYNVSLSSNYGYSGIVTLTCSGVPSWGSCTIAPSSLQLAAYGTTPLVVTVTTTQSARRGSFPFGTTSLVFAGVLMSAGSSRKRKALLALVLLGAAIAMQSGCGSSKADTSPPPSPTPASVAVIVTATDGTTTTNLVLGLQVNP